MGPLPKVLLVGGPDVDARLDLMHRLKTNFNVGALGTVPALKDRFAIEGFDYFRYVLHRRVHPILDVFSVAQLVYLFRRLRPQIVHAFDAKPCVWVRLAARLAGVPVTIGTLPGLSSLYGCDRLTVSLIRSIYQPLQKLASGLSDLTIFQNQDDARYFIRAGVVPEQKALVIPGSGVSTEEFDPARVVWADRLQVRQELGIQPDELVVTMVSRVIRSKGVLDFMAAAWQVTRHYPKARFLLVGPDDKDSIYRLDGIERTQLKHSLIWPGPRCDIPTILAASDMFVLPTAHNEGIPRALLEAASMGLPIVTTDVPGCREVVENGVNGFLTPVGDANALAEAILCLLHQPDLRHCFGRTSRQRTIERLDVSIIAAQTMQVYQNLLVRKGLLSGEGC
jgi:glycosyltransferase involved in cell wall biosynthesis